jgi:hypothetical protein
MAGKAPALWGDCQFRNIDNDIVALHGTIDKSHKRQGHLLLDLTKNV